MSVNKQSYAPPFSVTISGTAIAIATQAGTTAAIYYVTNIAGSSSGTAGTWTLIAGASGANGTTTLWQGSGAVGYQLSEPLSGFPGGSVIFTMNGTTTTYANITGFSL